MMACLVVWAEAAFAEEELVEVVFVAVQEQALVFEVVLVVEGLFHLFVVVFEQGAELVMVAHQVVKLH